MIFYALLMRSKQAQLAILKWNEINQSLEADFAGAGRRRAVFYVGLFESGRFADRWFISLLEVS
ncbi:hypothetical protein AB4851_00805 [Burkholderia sp. 22PA0099]|uniref:hypothetical protein n=1 Tax=Burkholderia sp. 22PA0099 TaxID=3237372 RepID=UPI0039C183FA